MQKLNVLEDIWYVAALSEELTDKPLARIICGMSWAKTRAEMCSLTIRVFPVAMARSRSCAVSGVRSVRVTFAAAACLRRSRVAMERSYASP